ncbi:MAG: hypothetical protein IPO15_17700 [Anaerolineae bacterium]|uniref:hypothetical protein n=1 Tax=Candidatus Amarolinea dominans TaxID=3140696 RepID=UPI0031370CA3|nr:hypothetical protein [Anaerolineae bacterium]
MMLSIDHDNDIYCAQTPVHTAAAPPCIPYVGGYRASPAPTSCFLWSRLGLSALLLLTAMTAVQFALPTVFAGVRVAKRGSEQTGA